MLLQIGRSEALSGSLGGRSLGGGKGSASTPMVTKAIIIMFLNIFSGLCKLYDVYNKFYF